MTFTGRDSRRDKVALGILAVAVVVSLTVYFWPQDSAAVSVVEAAGAIPAAEQRLAHLRELAAQAPEKATQLGQVRAGLEKAEAGLLRADTAQQAQAALLQALRQVADQQIPAIEFRNVDLGQARPYGVTESYGEVLVTVNFECAIEQLVNLLAELTSRPEAMATSEIQIASGAPATKNIGVRLTVAGLVPRNLVPETRGLSSF